MKKFIFCLSLISGLLTSANAEITANLDVYTAANIIKAFAYNNQQKVPYRTIEDAKAVAILFDVKKLAAVASLEKGQGIFITKNEDGEWTFPIFIRYAGFGLGFQLGYQSSDMILIFRTTRSYKGLFNGQDTLSANASAAFGGVGGEVGAATTFPEISGWIVEPGMSKGVYLGAAINLKRMIINDQLTNDFYDRIYDYQDILNGSPRDNKYTRVLRETLNKYFSNYQYYGECDTVQCEVNDTENAVNQRRQARLK